eukprot:CAMPEP_0202904240 /NCGR_PEP_ID=MMETSP1392-20130828/28435_1 /ASSEMBLY_ACC=CAM_ASM_000868 /TAXON_ID=225041 /ORGANISM="Chlamydomonas chlamydogama, Strain SAG 11-48b" /LENGTH=562 /DNA_ID=CAMNT_0049591775 /DNA_START=28 /DNA_END=1716 /DNA_ORIENTATION=-
MQLSLATAYALAFIVLSIPDTLAVITKIADCYEGIARIEHETIIVGCPGLVLRPGETGKFVAQWDTLLNARHSSAIRATLTFRHLTLPSMGDNHTSLYSMEQIYNGPISAAANGLRGQSKRVKFTLSSARDVAVFNRTAVCSTCNYTGAGTADDDQPNTIAIRVKCENKEKRCNLRLDMSIEDLTVFPEGFTPIGTTRFLEQVANYTQAVLQPFTDCQTYTYNITQPDGSKTLNSAHTCHPPTSNTTPNNETETASFVAWDGTKHDVAVRLAHLAKLMRCRVDRLLRYDCQTCKEIHGLTDRRFGQDPGNAQDVVMVAFDEVLNGVVVVFRSTFTIKQWMDNILGVVGPQKPFRMPDGSVPAWGHDGFISTVQSLRPWVYANVRDLMIKYRERVGHRVNVYVSGHSRGGALATLMSLLLAEHNGQIPQLDWPGTQIRLYVFGAPMSLDFSGGAKSVESRIRERFHIWWRLDPVPSLPGQIRRFEHVKPFVWFTKDGERPTFWERLHMKDARGWFCTDDASFQPGGYCANWRGHLDPRYFNYIYDHKFYMDHDMENAECQNGA